VAKGGSTDSTEELGVGG